MQVIITGSDYMKDMYMKKYGANLEQIHLLGNFQMDKFFYSKFKNEALEIVNEYNSMLDKVNIFYIPKNNSKIDSDVVKKLVSELGDKYNVFYYLDNKEELDCGIKVFDGDVKKMFLNINIIITNGNNIIFEMAKAIKNVYLINNSDDLNYLIESLKMNKIEISNIKELEKDWFKYDKGTTSRAKIGRAHV